MTSHSLQPRAVKKKNTPTIHRSDYRTPYSILRARLRARQLWESGTALHSTGDRDELLELVRGVAS